MTNLVILEHHRTFSSASNRARSLAIQHKKETALRRSPIGWDVLVPIALKSQVHVQNYEHDYDYGLDPDDHLIVEEMLEDQESWARSEEDGWYYADE